MPATLILLHLAGFVALLLWGMHMGTRASCVLSAATCDRRSPSGLKNRWKAFLAGLGITALLQSSTATALMSTSFIAAGFMTLAPALLVTLGANVGTTLIVQLLTFNVAAFAAGVRVWRADRLQQGRQDAHARPGPRRPSASASSCSRCT